MSYLEVRLEAHEELIAVTIGSMRRIKAIKRGGGEAYGRGDRAPWDDNIVGAMGELAFSRATGRHWPMSMEDYRAGLPDFPPDIEIKTLGRHSFDLTIRPDGHDDRRYVLVTGKRSPFRIHGWAWGHERERGELTDFSNGRPKQWRLARELLHDIAEMVLDGQAQQE